MCSEVAVSVKNLSKMYKLYNKPFDRIKEMVIPINKSYHREFYAIKNLSFEVKRGEVMGIVGVNGSGKSTLLKMITGVLTPTSGSIEVKGRIAALLELGAGFNPEFTGMENIFLQGSIMGYSKEEMQAKVADIIAFADIGEFIHQPVKTYSSGMFVRLAFAVNSCVDPDVLIVDEALSVGDFYFVQKCYRKIEETIKNGTAVIFVTHSMADMVKFCNQAILLSHGKCLYKNDPVFIMQKYLSMQKGDCSNYQEKNDNVNIELSKSYGSIERWPTKAYFQDVSNSLIEGNGCLKCLGIAVTNDAGVSTTTFMMGENANFYYEYEVIKDMDTPIFGVDIIDSRNNIIHGKQSLHCGMQSVGSVTRGTILRCKQKVCLDIAPDTYTTVVGMSMISDEYYQMADLISYAELTSKMERVISISKAIMLNVIPRKNGLPITFHGLCNLPGECEIETISKYDVERRNL